MSNRKFISKCNDDYNRRINDNKDAIIEAFVEYYGEKYRKLIIRKYNNIFFCWNFSNKTGERYKKVCDDILNERLNITIQILNRLGFNSIPFLDTVSGSITLKNDEVVVYPGRIYNVFCEENGYDVSMDGFLEMLFGKNRIFNFEYDSSPLYNFFFLSSEEKLFFVRKYFNQNETTPDVLEKIQSAISYMDEIKPYSEKLNEKEKRLVDLSLIDSYLYKSPFDRFLNDVIDREARIIGSTDKCLLRKHRRELESNISEIQKDSAFSCFSIPVNEENTAIYMPYFFVDDYSFFHEINHSLNNSVLGAIERKTYMEPINKNGLTVLPNTEFGVFDELLNDKISSEIAEIFKRKNGRVFDHYHYSKNHSAYSYCFPLIERFYQQFKDLIIEARITENSNLLYSVLDKKKFRTYVDFVSGVSRKIIKQIMIDPSFVPEISKDEILKSNQLVDDMILKDKNVVLSRKEQLEELRGYAINLKFLESDEVPQNLSSYVGIKK